MAETLEELETRRAVLLRMLAATGDMRQGSITESYRSCGAFVNERHRIM